MQWLSILQEVDRGCARTDGLDMATLLGQVSLPCILNTSVLSLWPWVVNLYIGGAQLTGMRHVAFGGNIEVRLRHLIVASPNRSKH